MGIIGGKGVSIADPVIAAQKNILINGDGIIVQRAIGTAINDDTYAFDRWVILSDGNGVVTPTQELADVPTGARSAMKLTVASANAKFGFVQIVEGENSKIVIDGFASLLAQAKSSGISNLRVAVLSWDGTEDSVTSDVVSAWNAAGTDPTLVADWTYENTPANIPLATVYQNIFAAPNISIDTASTKQVAVFIWVDDTDAEVNDTLFLTNVQLENGSESTDFEYRPIAEELSLAQRYFQKTFPLETAPIQNAGRDGAIVTTGNNIGKAVFQWSLKSSMRSSPTVTTFNPSAANASARNLDDATDSAVNITAETHDRAVYFDNTIAGNANDFVTIHATADSEL